MYSETFVVSFLRALAFVSSMFVFVVIVLCALLVRLPLGLGIQNKSLSQRARF